MSSVIENPPIFDFITDFVQQLKQQNRRNWNEMRLSGLQRDVLSLYRKCLRESRKKSTDARPHFEAFTRNEFRKALTLDKKDFGTIEYLLRKGQRQLEMYSSPGIKDIR